MANKSMLDTTPKTKSPCSIPYVPALTKTKFFALLALNVIFSFVVCCIALFIGSEKLDFGTPIGKEIFFYYRIPRVILGFFAGGTLSLVGCIFQMILRNPLATPYTLGITSAGALGAVIGLAFPTIAMQTSFFSSAQILSLLGSFIAMFIVYKFSHKNRYLSVNTLLLAGITIGIFCNSFIMLVRYISNPQFLVVMDRWMMGGLSITGGYQEISSILPFLLPGLFLLFMQMPQINQLSFGREMAASFGVDVEKMYKQCFIGGCLATASVVSVTGAIGFVGLIVPHAMKKTCGYDHRLLLPACFFSGGTFLVVCDVFARTLLAPTEIPVGILTSFIGVPVFIWILLRK